MSALRTSVSLTLLVAPLALLTGCGSGLANNEWLAEPESGALTGDASTTLERTDTVAFTTSDSAPRGGPQRLDHTITLGEVVATPRDPTAVAAAAPPPASVVINVNNYGAPPTYGYATVPVGVTSSTSRSSTSTASTSRGSGSSSITPGQSWPSPASAGPSFPFSTSPASPWEAHK